MASQTFSERVSNLETTVYNGPLIGGGAGQPQVSEVDLVATPGTALAKVIFGAGAPSNSDGSPQGTIYLRTDGGAGTTIYAKTGVSTYTAVSTVAVGGADTQVIFNDSGVQQGDTGLTFNKTTNVLTVTGGIIGGQQDATVALTADGAITIAPGTVILNKAGVLAATLAAPTATTHDGIRIAVIAKQAQANTITFASGKINGGSLTTATFGGAIGDSIILEAYQGIWYTVTAPRNVTIS